MAQDRPDAITVQALARRVSLLIWNGTAPPPARDLRVFIGRHHVRPPFMQTSLALDTSSHRNILAIAAELPSAPVTIEVRTSDARTLARCEDDGRGTRHTHEFDAHALLARLDGGERARLARFLLETCASLFRLSADPLFVAHARSLLAEIGAGTGMLTARCTLQPGHVFCEGTVPDALGERLSAVVLTADGVHRVATAPALLPAARTSAGVEGLGIVLPRAAGVRGASVVVFGENGLICRKLGTLPRRLPGVHDWFARIADRKPQHRRYLLDCLAQPQPSEHGGFALLRELRAMCPGGSGDGGPTAAPRGTTNLIVGCADGIFVSGRITDPHRLVDSILIERRGVVQTVAIEALARFPATEGGTGFVLFADAADGCAGDAPVQLHLGLRSGARIELGEGPALLSPEQAAAAVLASIPEAGTPDDALLVCVERALHALSRERRSAAEAMRVLDCGTLPARPEASVVIPFTEDAELLRCRMSVFAADRSLAGVEFIFLVDRPERRAEAERLLTGLRAVYGIAARLLVFEETATAGATMEVAADMARGSLIAFLGATAVPEAPGWLRTLGRFVLGRSSRGIAGAQALHPDHSLVSAGSGAGLDSRGAWAIRPLLAGFPRDYAPASVPTRVTALAFDCVVLRRSLLRDVSGFAADYLLEASVQADLCLRARAHGLEVWRLPEPAVFRLGGNAPAVPMASIELDRRLLERRWREVLEKDAARRTPRPVTQEILAEEPATQPAAARAAVAPAAAIQKAA